MPGDHRELNERGLFLVGAERSGTTLLRLMLAHHPELAWQNEFEFAVDLMAEDGSFPSRARYAEWLSTHRIFRASKLQVLERDDYPAIVRGFLDQKRDRASKPIVGATVHRHFVRLLRVWPRARFVHLIRDPRDVARSVMGMGWAGNVWTGSAKWIHAEEEWDALRRRLPAEDWCELRYEDLIADPERELTRLCEFIGVRYSPAMLSYPEDTTYEAPNAAMGSQWKKKLTPSEVALVEGRVGSLLSSRGYEPAGAPRTPTAMESVGLAVQDRWYRATFRTRRYGLGLQLGLAMTSRLGMKAAHKQLLERMHAMDRERLK